MFRFAQHDNEETMGLTIIFEIAFDE